MKDLYHELMDIHLVCQKVVFLRCVRYTILPALTLDGFIACDIMRCSCSKERYCSFVSSFYLKLPVILFLPLYSPDRISISTVNSWIKRNKDFMETCPDPEFAIIAEFSQITPMIAKSYFKKSIYLQ
ncbi:unnamed protein product [Rhizophagus irregularis]|nr:unnamed protein product [Rhizophagus irregularis]